MGIPVFSIILGFRNYQVGNYMFKVNSRNTRTRFELFSKLTIKSQLRSGIFIVNFEQIPQCCSVSIVNFEQVNAARTTFPELKLTSRSTQELGCLPSPINQRAWQGGVFHIHKCVISVFFYKKGLKLPVLWGIRKGTWSVKYTVLRRSGKRNEEGSWTIQIKSSELLHVYRYTSRRF